MNAGVAALVLAFVTLAEFRDAWNGELVLTLVGDEETGGRWGTWYLLAKVEEAVDDAMLNADTGSPRVVRIGEKGNVWVELKATGIANHAAHVHLGRNAVDAHVDALGAVRVLAEVVPELPAAVERTIAEAQSVSEADSGKGEAETLRRITVTTGRIKGGIGVNTIPDRARALCDIRISPGVSGRPHWGGARVRHRSASRTCRGGSSNARSRAGRIRRRRSSGRSARTRLRSPGGMLW